MRDDGTEFIRRVTTMINALKLAGGGRVAVPLLRLPGGAWMTPAVTRGLAWAVRRFPPASRDTHTHTHTA